MRKKATRLGLVILLAFLGLVPVIYPYLASLLSGQKPTVSTVDFTVVSEAPVPPSFLLAYANAALGSVQEGNYAEAHRMLAMIDELPPNTESTLRTYITLVNETVSILDSTSLDLQQLRGLIADGAIDSARQKISDIEGLLDNASKRLDLLFYSLDRIAAIYGVDITAQRQHLSALSSILQGFVQALAELKTLLASLDLRAATQLELSASPNPVQVTGTLQISGQLWNGSIGLPGRVVELWINGIQVANSSLDEYGRFNWQYYVSSSTRLYGVEVYARYTPVGTDLAMLRPARSPTILVPVNYSPVVLTMITSSNRLHVLEGFTVQGNLTDSTGRPLAGETVQLLIDNGTIASSDTDSTGQYSMTASFPLGAVEGNHQLYALYDPTQGIYASASSEKIPIQLYYLRPTISLLSGEVLALSGQTVQLKGHLEVDSEPFKGSVVALLGEEELGHAVSDNDGAFNMTLSVPFGATGDNVVKIVLVPDEPWVATSVASLVLNVLNSGVIGLGIGAIASLGVMLSGRPVGRRRREAEAVAVEKQEAGGEAVSAPAVICSLDGLRKIEDARLCILETYWEVRRVLGEVLHDPGRLSETHREYEARALTRLGDGSSSFSALTQLFELAKYSRHVLSRLEAEEGINHAILVAEAVGAEVRP